ncbi:MAG: hypothetical protein IBX68_01015 [Dehalococcoidia bacterium]|nr:hypothetical protein [Dehalococcoidia bacterium]
MKRVYSLFMVSLLLTVLLVPSTGCGGTGSAQSVGALSLVPEGAAYIVYIDIARLISDEDLCGDGNGGSCRDILDGITDQIGLSADELWEVMVFGKVPAGPSDPAASAALITTAVEKERFIALIEEAGGQDLVPGQYRSFDIYVDDFDENAIAFPDEGLIVMGSLSIVKEVLDTRAGEQAALGGELKAKYDALPSNALVKAAGVMPPGENVSSAEFWGPLTAARTYAGSVVKSGSTFRFEGELCFTSLESAYEACSVLEAALAMLRMVDLREIPGYVPVPEESLSRLQELAETVTVEVRDSSVFVSLEITP